MGRKKGGGGKLNRSEIVQARLNPKLRFAAELIARKERRTLSSLLESSLEIYLKTCRFDVLLNDEDYRQQISIDELLELVWNPDEAIRFAKMGFILPQLLTSIEEKIFSFILDKPFFWAHYEVNIVDPHGKLLRKDKRAYLNLAGLVEENLKEFWDEIKTSKNLDKLKIPDQIGMLRTVPDDCEAEEVESYDYNIPLVNDVMAEKDRYSIWIKNISKLLKQEFETIETPDGPRTNMKIIYPTPEEQREMVERIFQESNKCPSSSEK